MKKIPKALEPRWLIVFVFFLSGIFLGSLSAYLWINAQTPVGYKLHPQQSSYQYINPLLGTETINETTVSQNETMKLEIEKIISEAKKNETIESAGVYFRDIEPGSWMGVNEDSLFSPGKLLKIPLMIAYFKIAEGDPDSLNDSIVFEKNSSSLTQELKTQNPLEAGKEYTVAQLIRSMIVDRNDNAANLLFDHIDKAPLNEIFSDLGITFKEDKETQDFLSLKAYSLFFRVLYNATYLNHDYSEKALGLLHEGDTSRGIVSQIPKNILTATRAGGRQYSEKGSSVSTYELYDCGIIYYPSHPYLLCATARGKNSESVWNFLGTIGSAVYKNFSYQYPR